MRYLESVLGLGSDVGKGFMRKVRSQLRVILMNYGTVLQIIM